jgi:hypothetical protein
MGRAMNSQPNLPFFKSAQLLFEAEHLPFPAVPRHLASRMTPFSRSVFATRALAHGPYGLGGYQYEIEQSPALAEYALVGFDGHGTNSWAAHYFLVSGPLALFIQLPWGGAYGDAVEDRAEIVKMFAWASSLQALIAQAAAQERIPTGWRLMVVATHFGDSGWRWLKPGQVPGEVGLNTAQGMKFALINLLSNVVSGRVDLTGPASV